MAAFAGFGVVLPFLRITEAEARVMAESQLRAEQAFGVTVSPKTQAVTALVGSHFAIFAPKLLAGAAMARQRQQERAQRAQAGPRGFGGARPAPPGAPPSGPAPDVMAGGGAVIIPTGAPDAGAINFGG